MKSALLILIATCSVYSGFAQATNALNSTGNVGIGTTAPQAKLHVYDPGSNVSVRVQNNASFFEMQSNGQDGYLNLIGTGNLYFRSGTNAETRLTLTGSGNLGIGTPNPGEKLAVKGNIVADGGRLFSEVSSAEGGNLVLGNPSKTGATANNWVIWNMTNPYGNGLSFWRYFADGTNAGPSVWFDDNGSVGIGTTSPGAKLEVNQMTAPVGVRVDTRWDANIRLNDGTSDSAEFRNNGIGATRLVTLYGRSLEIGTLESKPLIMTTSSVERIRVDPSGNVGIGTTNPTQKLSVNGTIKAKEVIVETAGWSDYVFTEGYSLASLSEVEQQIQKDGHLPGIPSAQEVNEKGIGVGEMQAKLLAKIEELTLHLIEQQKRIERLTEQNAELNKRIQAVEGR